VEWYVSIGFEAVRYHEEDGLVDWALVSFGNSELMFSMGGRPSPAHRREVDLYIHCDDIEPQVARLKDKVEIVEDLHDTFYGMREFIFRDLNRFWITFGQPIES
jgi:uncharacterized glyoxalase superfamily protein PhnB